MNIQFTDENGQSLGGIDGGRNRVYQLGLFYVLSAAKEKAQIE
jgi:hypothetical protein